MPVCVGCDTSYDENFKFCPNCGKAKSEQEKIVFEIQAKPYSYEEAVLKIETVKREIVTEYPFNNYKPNPIEKWLDGGRNWNWNEVTICKFALQSIHPSKGEYTVFESSSFRAFYVKIQNDEMSFPIPIKNMLSSQNQGIKWIENFFDERSRAWKQLNNFLIGNGWVGITYKAKERIPPLEIEISLGGIKSQLFLHDGYLKISNYLHFEEIEDKYRYQKQLS